MIQRNRHPAGRLHNALFGICQIADGLVRVLSLGHLHTRLTLELSSYQTRLYLVKLKERNKAHAHRDHQRR